VTKPFSIRVLEARIERLLARRAAPERDGALKIGGLTLDRETHEASLHGEPLPLTVTEFRLLSSLLEADGKVLSRASLIKYAMGSGVTITERTIDVHVTSIRKKLGSLAPIIKTVRGVGYRIDRDAAETESNGHTAASATD
jgi:DNA-binding response OmpR family regulator